MDDPLYPWTWPAHPRPKIALNTFARSIFPCPTIVELDAWRFWIQGWENRVCWSWLGLFCIRPGARRVFATSASHEWPHHPRSWAMDGWGVKTYCLKVQMNADNCKRAIPGVRHITSSPLFLLLPEWACCVPESNLPAHRADAHTLTYSHLLHIKESGYCLKRN